jgi:trehalose 6-phosphate synthase/trehalose 6-phosphate phosphatase
VAHGRARDLPAALWQAALSAEHRLLLMDYDGTLTPFRIDRQEARPLPGTTGLLERIAGGGRTGTAVISGRPLADLERLLDVRGLTLVGEHGWERRTPGEETIRHAVPAEAAARLRDLAEAGRSTRWGEWLEVKRASLVLHTRGMPVHEAVLAVATFETLWGAADAGLRLQPIDGGLEVRATGHDKGTAVQELLKRSPAGSWLLYIGDDRSDEDGFRAIEGRGVGIRVGTDDRWSNARHQVDGPEEVVEFLRQWVETVETAPDDLGRCGA